MKCIGCDKRARSEDETRWGKVKIANHVPLHGHLGFCSDSCIRKYNEAQDVARDISEAFE